ncbi:hypothetical protein [Streptomyces paradoxus]|uniref:Uncharacterized protein n=1 Tax=Streptomyces paradoxus TaxID=66375 RepID=A0A7W9TK35_9ACTN|nr:hypothetical protein [Streptomyces paradoxus]MBB6081102.1 hypothetical protein [Streptomyces paradoxus]
MRRLARDIQPLDLGKFIEELILVEDSNFHETIPAFISGVVDVPFFRWPVDNVIPMRSALISRLEALSMLWRYSAPHSIAVSQTVVRVVYIYLFGKPIFGHFEDLVSDTLVGPRYVTEFRQSLRRVAHEETVGARDGEGTHG